MPQAHRNKIGRNDICPCGSGKKYKRCHGEYQQATLPSVAIASKKVEKYDVLEIQRKAQQGLGKSILTTDCQGKQVVVVGARDYEGNWKTFHDFLCDYIKSVMGSNWGSEELKKPIDERHPLIKLYDIICRYQQSFIKTPGTIHTAPFTGAVAAYMWLSYNLYLIFHNSNNIEFQAKLLKRLKQIDQFAGANYETYIAAIFIKAGFTLEFENESDGTTSHCEFTATHTKSGLKFSVEAKLRSRKNIISPNQGAENFKLGVERMLYRALKKNASYQRIVFIDLNFPSTEINKYTSDDLVRLLEKCEKNPTINESLPPAYVLLTNYSYHYDIDATDFQQIFFAGGFKISDFGNKKTTLQDAIIARKKHQPIHDLWNSIKEHTIIPSTFDGSIPEFTFSNNERRLIIGNKYLVHDQIGNEQTVELQQATVDEVNKSVSGLF